MGSPLSLVQCQTQRMSSLFIQKHHIPQPGHLDHRPAQCCGTYTGKQIYVVPRGGVLSWALQDVTTSSTLPGKCQSSQAQQSTAVSQ